MTLYLKVTTDKYQLPVAVADSPGELAKIIGVNRTSVNSMVTRGQSGLIRVRIDEEEEVFMGTKSIAQFGKVSFEQNSSKKTALTAK